MKFGLRIVPAAMAFAILAGGVVVGSTAAVAGNNDSRAVGLALTSSVAGGVTATAPRVGGQPPAQRVSRAKRLPIVARHRDPVGALTEMSMPPDNSPDGAKRTAQPLAAARGWTGSEWSCLLTIWTHESDWRVSATNASSGAYGIAQALPAEKYASYGSDWQTSAETQIKWGLAYIASSYGTPCSAWSFWQAHIWY